jgi:hypothetical protein
MNNVSRIAAGGLLSMLIAASASAGTTTATFDFEGQATTTGGALTTLSLTNNGLSVTIDRAGESFDVVELSSQSGTTAFGSRSLVAAAPLTTFYNVNFSQPVSSFSVQMGNFGTGITDNLALTAFTGINGTGTNLGTTSDSLVLTDASTLAIKTLQISGAGIRSVEFVGGDTVNANSAFVDNFGATFATSGGIGGTGGTGGNGGGPSAVPLPSALLVAPLGALVAWFGARRLRLVTAK